MKRYLIPFLIFFLLLLLCLGIYRFLKNRQDENTLTLYGNVDIRQVDLGFRVEGRVVFMPFEEGDFVPEGALVAELDRQPYLDQVSQAKATAAAVEINLKNAEKTLKRRQELIGNGSVSQEDLDNASASRDALAANLKQAEAAVGVAITNLNDTKVFSPTNGTILTRIREPGSVVKPADPVYTLSVTTPVWIRAFVPEPSLGRIYPGMKANIYTDSNKDKVYQGHVGFISPVAEFTPKTVETTQLRTDLVYRLRIYADNPDQALRQGMPVTVELPLNSDEEKK